MKLIIFIFTAFFILVGCFGLGVFNLTSSSDDKVSLSDIREYMNSGAKREYSWGQKLELSFVHQGKTYTGSSIVEVSWIKRSPRINDAPWASSYMGHMPYVVLDDGGVVVMLSKNRTRGLVETLLLDSVTRSSGNWITEEQLRHVYVSKDLVKVLEYDDPNFPYVVKFANPNDPTTISFFETPHATLTVMRSAFFPQKSKLPKEMSDWISDVASGTASRLSTKFDLPSGGYSAVYTQDLLGE